MNCLAMMHAGNADCKATVLSAACQKWKKTVRMTYGLWSFLFLFVYTENGKLTFCGGDPFANSSVILIK